MRNAPEVIDLTCKYYKEVNPDDDDLLVPDPILATYIGSLKALPDCNILVTIDSGNSSPSRDALINFCKRSRNTMVYYVSNDGKLLTFIIIEREKLEVLDIANKI